MEEQVGHDVSPFLTLSYLQSALANMPLIVLLSTFPQCQGKSWQNPWFSQGLKHKDHIASPSTFSGLGECLLPVTPSTPLAKPLCILGEGVQCTRCAFSGCILGIQGGVFFFHFPKATSCATRVQKTNALGDIEHPRTSQCIRSLSSSLLGHTHAQCTLRHSLAHVHLGLPCSKFHTLQLHCSLGSFSSLFASSWPGSEPRVESFGHFLFSILSWSLLGYSASGGEVPTEREVQWNRGSRERMLTNKDTSLHGLAQNQTVLPPTCPNTSRDIFCLYQIQNPLVGPLTTEVTIKSAKSLLFKSEIGPRIFHFLNFFSK